MENINKEEYIKILECVMLLLDGTTKTDIMVKYNLFPQLKKGEQIVKFLQNG